MDNNTVTKHSNFHWSVHTETIIEAPRDKVWSVLMDFDSMSQWSNTLQKIEGNLSSESKTRVEYIFKEKLREIKHKMVDFEEGTQFGWSDTLIPFAKDYHIYRIESLPDGRSRFIQKDEVRGITAFLVAKMLMDEMIKTYPEFNRRLKKIVESN